MKNLRIITLTAICMMTGISLLEAKALSEVHSMRFTNNTTNHLSIECKSQYEKKVNGFNKIRYDKETLTIPAGESKIWNYHTKSNAQTDKPQYIKIKDTVNRKHLDIEKKVNMSQLARDGGNNIINADYTITTISENETIVTTKINGNGTTTVTTTPKTGTQAVETKPSSDKDLVLK